MQVFLDTNIFLYATGVPPATYDVQPTTSPLLPAAFRAAAYPQHIPLIPSFEIGYIP